MKSKKPRTIDVTTLVIRDEAEADLQAVREVNLAAFGRDDEADLVDALRAGSHSRVALIASLGEQVVGHIMFTDLAIVTRSGNVEALALAPVAVAPEFQRRGIGSALVKEGLNVARVKGSGIVVVLGHPEFYPRFGFSAELAKRLESPFSGPAFMAVELIPDTMKNVEGSVRYAPPFGIT